MKKRAAGKRKPKKSVKTQPPLDSIAVEQDIMGLLTLLVQKLTSFEAKIDTVLSRVSQTLPVEPLRKPPVPVLLPEPRRDSRPTYKAVCADCGRDCEVPFKPSGNRPVYCRECFAKRKSSVILKPPAEGKPKEPVPAPVLPPAEPKTIETKTAQPPGKASPKKKPAVKKKTKIVRRK